MSNKIEKSEKSQERELTLEDDQLNSEFHQSAREYQEEESSSEEDEVQEELDEEQRVRKNVNFSAMLERMINPVDSTSLRIIPHGMFNLPEDIFKVHNELPGIFDYRVKIFGQEIRYGVPLERELTEEEKEQLKKKKGKPSTPRSQKSALEADELERMLREELTEEEREWREYENKFKHPSLRFELDHQKEMLLEAAQARKERLTKERQESLKLLKKQGTKVDDDTEDVEIPLVVSPAFEFKLEGDNLAEFEEAMNTGKLTFIFERFADMDEAEFQKARKKVKGALEGELGLLKCKVEINLSEAQIPGTLTFTGRGKIVQIDSGVNPLQPPEEIQLKCKQYDFSNTYFKIELQSDSPLTPDIGELMPSVDMVTPEIKGYIPKITDRVKYTGTFKRNLQESIYSIANDYKATFDSNGLTRVEELQKYRIFNKQQEMQFIKQRKETYISKFVVSDKYQVLRESLRDSILRLVHDKFEKDLSPFNEEESSPRRLVSEIHIYMKKELDFFIEQSMTRAQQDGEADTIHIDLVESYLRSKAERDSFYNFFILDDDRDAKSSYLNLCREYESLNMMNMAERRYKDILRIEYENPVVWYEYSKFKLKQLDYIAAEEALWKAIEYSPNSPEYQVILCCFYLRRGRISEAKSILENLIQKDKLNLIYNSFLALVYQYYIGNSKLCRKYFNVAQRVEMRSRGMLPPRSDKPNYNNQGDLKELSVQDRDGIWMKLISFFSAHCFIELTLQGIEMLKNRDINEVWYILSITEFLKNNYAASDQYLDTMLANKPEDPSKILLTKSLNSYMRENFYEAEEYILMAVKANPKETLFFDTTLRLGFMYLRRESKEDAKFVLSKACNAHPKSAMAWYGLGIACIKLGDLVQASKALKMANILDPINADIWGYTILLSLRSGSSDEALELLDKYFALEIEDLIILHAIGDELAYLNLTQEALSCFEKIDQLYPSYGTLYINTTLDIGIVYWMIADLNHDLKRFNEAVTYYGKALGVIEGNSQQARIKELMNEAIMLRDGTPSQLKMKGTENSFEYEEDDSNG